MHEALAQTLTALELAVRLSLPALGAAFAVSLVLALLQALSRMTDPALSAIPRALVTLLVVGSAAGWIGSELAAYSLRLFRALPGLSH